MLIYAYIARPIENMYGFWVYCINEIFVHVLNKFDHRTDYAKHYLYLYLQLIIISY